MPVHNSGSIFRRIKYLLNHIFWWFFFLSGLSVKGWSLVWTTSKLLPGAQKRQYCLLIGFIRATCLGSRLPGSCFYWKTRAKFKASLILPKIWINHVNSVMRDSMWAPAEGERTGSMISNTDKRRVVGCVECRREKNWTISREIF